jgi:hypothetical protein
MGGVGRSMLASLVAFSKAEIPTEHACVGVVLSIIDLLRTGSQGNIQIVAKHELHKYVSSQ